LNGLKGGIASKIVEVKGITSGTNLKANLSGLKGKIITKIAECYRHKLRNQSEG
jgi:hypothetical protein